jgi:hypothetical protein
MADEIDEMLMTTAAVRKALGDVSDMYIVRRLADDPTFPKPLYICRRRYWTRGAISAWKALKAANQDAERPNYRAGAAARQAVLA